MQRARAGDDRMMNTFSYLLVRGEVGGGGWEEMYADYWLMGGQMARIHQFCEYISDTRRRPYTTYYVRPSLSVSYRVGLNQFFAPTLQFLLDDIWGSIFSLSDFSTLVDE